MASELDLRFKLKWCKPIEYNELKGKLVLKLNQQLQNEQDSQTTGSTETNDNNSTVTLTAISEQIEEESEHPAKKIKNLFQWFNK